MSEPNVSDPQVRGIVRPLSIAPMMQRTDRHCRVLFRQITRQTLLYTEMVTTGALIHGERSRYLDYSPIEHPIALQVGGDDPTALAECARMAQDWGYDEVNINVGCPSDRVQKGCFGAVLMTRPEQVAAGVKAMRAVVDIPVTVKHRIGVDDQDTYEHMLRFVDVVSAEGCDRFTVHARKAWLSGLSPKENRDIPPLRYEDVYRLKAERPDLVIEINGGITSMDAVADHLDRTDAVMIGRAAYDEPMLFASADRRFFGEEQTPEVDIHAVAESMVAYADERMQAGDRLNHITRHLLSLFSGRPGGRHWRRILTEGAIKPGAGPDLILEALERVRSVAALVG